MRRRGVARALTGCVVALLASTVLVASGPSATSADEEVEQDRADRSIWAGGPAGDHARMTFRSDVRPPDVVRTWLPGSSRVSARWEEERGLRLLRVSLRDDEAGMDLVLAAPPGEELTERTYRNVRPLDDLPGDEARRTARFDVEASDTSCTDWYQATVDVRRIDEDLQQLWLVVDAECGTLTSRVSGEARVGAPAPDGPRLGTSSLTWPAEHPGDPSPVLPVVVQADDADRTVAVSLAETRHFRLVDDDCGQVAAGDACRVLVAFEPRATGEKRTVLRVRDPSGTTTVPLTGTVRPGRTRWQVDDGRSVSTQTPTDSDVVVLGDRREVTWRVDDGGYLGEASGTFRVPGGIVEGRTYVADTFAGPGEPSLSLWGNSTAGATDPAGVVTVRRARFGPDGEVRSLALTYRNGSGIRERSASLTFASPRTWAAPAVPPPTQRPEVFVFRTEPRVGGVDVDWDAEGLTDGLTAVLRVGPTDGGPQRVAYRGTRSRFAVDGLLPGQDVRLSLTLRDRWGNTSRPETRVVHGSRLLLRPDGAGRVTGRLLDGDARGLPNQPVTVTTTGPAGVVTSVERTTGSGGSFSVAGVAPGGQVTAVFAGTSYFYPEGDRWVIGSSAYTAAGARP